MKNKLEQIDARDVCRVPLGKPAGGGEEVCVRVGRYGPFLQQGDRRVSLPENMPPDELTVEAAVEMLEKAAVADEPLGICPDTHKPVFLKLGRFGPYLQRGTPEDDQKPQNASLLRGMEPDKIDLETALKLLSLPRTLGDHPTNGDPVEAFNGRYGPYVKCGDETRALPNELSPLEVTLEEALTLLAQPKSPRGRARRKQPLKVFDTSPVTGQPVQLLEGRYGPYVTDGKTNASLPRGASPEEVTFKEALDLLKARAESGPAKRPSKKATKKKTAKKKTTKKKAARKKTTKK